MAETLARKGIENDARREGAYRFLTTGDPELFRETGRALPPAADRRGRARHVAELERAAGMSRARRQAARPAAPARDRSRLPRAAARRRCSTRRGRRACSARPRSRRTSRAGCADRGRGWMTAEYSLLPASTGERTAARGARGRQQGRTVEIQRLIGRAVRAVADFEALGERTLWLDCDVLQADGGTRCAAISGAYVAARRALDRFGLSQGAPPTRSPPSRRDRRRRAAARPRLRGGLERRRRPERRDDRRRPARRGAGDRRAGSVRPRRSSTSCSSWPQAGIGQIEQAQEDAVDAAPLSVPIPRPGLDRLTSALLAERAQAARARARSSRLGRSSRSTRTTTRRRAATLLRERPRQGALRARASARPSAWMLGEDSGLEVDALGGAPGVHSARWRRGRPGTSGCSGSCAGSRPTARARYVCELVAIAPGRRRARGTGVARGPIADEPRGTAGFGYDPVFVPDGRGADGRRARRRLEGAQLAPRACGARAARRLRQARCLDRAPRRGASRPTS